MHNLLALPQIGFHKHMREKAEAWRSLSVEVGDDFAVFTFDHNYQLNNAVSGVRHYASYFNYRYDTDKKNRLVIIDKKAKTTEVSKILC